MLDVHCHILPQVDDGPTSLEISLEIARFCVNDGIKVIVATPHCHRYIHLLRDEILPKVAQFNRELQSAGIPLTVLPGSEIQVNDPTEFRREFEAGLFCHLGDGRGFTLLEFNWARELVPPGAASLIAWIRDQRMTPILAHPERHPYFANEPELLEAIVDAGAWLQITVDSLLGNHGPQPKVLAEAFLNQYPLAVLATDAHNLQRCSGLAAGFAWVREHLGIERENDLRGRANFVLGRLLPNAISSSETPSNTAPLAVLRHP